MRRVLAIITLVATLAISLNDISYAQNGTGRPYSQVNAVTSLSTPSWAIAGRWTYRSYRNRPDVIINDDSQSAAKALALLFGEGTMTLTTPSATKISGNLDMGGGYVLDLVGTIQVNSSNQTIIRISGPGRPGTPTAGWEYDYDGVLTSKLPTGVDQIPAIVGSVIRVKPHGSAKAGYVASFIAVKQP